MKLFSELLIEDKHFTDLTNDRANYEKLKKEIKIKKFILIYKTGQSFDECTLDLLSLEKEESNYRIFFKNVWESLEIKINPLRLKILKLQDNNAEEYKNITKEIFDLEKNQKLCEID